MEEVSMQMVEIFMLMEGMALIAVGDLLFKTYDSGYQERMRITSTGLVGIGTTTPSALLEISSTTANDFLKLTSAGGGANPIKLIFEKSSAEQGIIEYNRNGDLEIYNTDSDGGVMMMVHHLLVLIYMLLILEMLVLELLRQKKNYLLVVVFN